MSILEIASLLSSLSRALAALSTQLRSVGMPLINHLWQSTFFAAAAVLLTLTLKKHQARVRYWIWLIASMKFLVPFSLLVDLGSRYGWTKPAETAPRFYSVIQQIGQPFVTAQPSSAAPALSPLLPDLLLLVWTCGCAAVLLSWWRQWRRITVPLRRATPAANGREWEMLRRIEQRDGASRPTRLLISTSALEPGMLGIFRPVMVLPRGIGGHLSDAQLEAIMTHELCHARRHDNLAAALHMLVEAIFWFHPLVWWIGARLLDERERACDEQVLTLGSEPQTYAEGILKVCEFCLESPLVCVAGVTGSNLKRRIETIMVHRTASKLNLGKRILLVALAVATLAGPIALGLLHPASIQAQSQAPDAVAFTSVSIQAKGPATGIVTARIWGENQSLTLRNITLKELIGLAYELQNPEILGGPDWIKTELYDLDLKTNAPAPPQATEARIAESADRSL